MLRFVVCDALYSSLYAANLPYTTDIPNIWDYDTILWAKFQGNLNAGNVDFRPEDVDFLRIKRRMKDSFDWVFMYEIPVFSMEDFRFELYDRTVRSETTYEYAIVPVISGSIEGGYIVNDVDVKFSGLFIVDRNEFYSTILEIDFNKQQQNKPISVVQTMGKKYPFVISNGLNNYKSGSITALFALLNEYNCEFDFKQAWKLLEKLNAFLYNNNAKLIKYEDGRMYLSSISSNTISEFDDDTKTVIKTSFEWTEIAKCDKGDDLYKYGFIDVKDGGNMDEQKILDDRLNRIEYELQVLRKTKADDLIFDESNGTLQLSAEEIPIGTKVDLETPFGKEFIIREL